MATDSMMNLLDPCQFSHKVYHPDINISQIKNESMHGTACFWMLKSDTGNALSVGYAAYLQRS